MIHITYINHILKLIFDAYKNIFIIFFVYIYKNGKEKLQKEARERYQNLSEEEKQKKVEYMSNYYLADKKKYFLRFYKVVWKLRVPKTNFNI